MARESHEENLTSKNLDQLSAFLTRELANPTLIAQMPNGAHIFHGASNDTELTRENLHLATKLLLGMALGYIEEAPLLMVFEREDGQHVLLDLSETLPRSQAQAFIGRFQEQSQQKMTAKINQLLTI